jgi:hypothetical protein
MIKVSDSSNPTFRVVGLFVRLNEEPERERDKVRVVGDWVCLVVCYL